MTDKHADIRESLALITEGKWFTYRDEETYVGALKDATGDPIDEPIAECHEWVDAQFIANAPEYVRRLLDEVERKNDAVKSWQSVAVWHHDENERLRKALDDIEMLIRCTRDPVPYIARVLKRAEGTQE